jgi:hypothetical protein
LKKDADLDSLRSREDFQQFVAELEAAGNQSRKSCPASKSRPKRVNRPRVQEVLEQLRARARAWHLGQWRLRHEL